MEKKSVMDRNTAIKMIITFAIPILCCFIPTGEVFTVPMRTAIALTVWLLLWAAFELSDLAVPSVIWTAMMVFTKTVDAATIFGVYSSLTFYGAMSMMLFATVMARVGVLTRLAYWIAEKAGGTFGKLTFGVFFGVFAIAAATFTGGVIIAAAFVYGVCKALDLVGTKEGGILTMAGIMAIGTSRMFWAYPITMGMMNTSVQTTANPDFYMNFTTLFKYNWPSFFFSIIFIYLVLVFTKTKNKQMLGGKDYFREELNKMGTMSREEKLGILFLICILAWVILNPIHHWDMMYAFCFFSMLLFFPGIDIGKKEDFKNFSLGTLLFVMACMSIGSVCAATGIVAAVKGILGPILASAGSTMALYLVVAAAMIGNLGMTPNALLAGFSGMIYTIFEGIGMNPLAALFAWNMGCDLVFLPYEYATPLLFMAFGTMSTSQFLKLNIFKNALFFVFFGVVMIPFWFIMGLL